MLKTPKNISNLKIIKEQSDKIYNHLKDRVQTDSPEIIIERFRYLFIKGYGYKEREIRLALDGVIESNISEIYFHIFLNRCLQMIISHWHKSSESTNSIPLLIAQLDLSLPPGSAHSKAGRKLRVLVKAFQNTEQYIYLKRLGRLLNKNQETLVFQNDTSLGSLIKRYPCLHQHCLLTQDSSYEFQKVVKIIKKNLQRNYDFEISQYVTYQARIAETARQSPTSDKFAIKPVTNPSLISDRKLKKTLHQYLGKVEKNHTYRDLACNFLTHTSEITSYKLFKNELYKYITSGLNSEYCKSKLNPKIYHWLDEILPNDSKGKLDDFTMIRTCSYLLKFLIVESKKNPEHYLFIDMIVNMGTTEVIGLLLKLVLICPKVKPYLEQRFAILFSHYEFFAKDELTWLINCLEKLQLAFSIHFGKVDLSLVKII